MKSHDMTSSILLPLYGAVAGGVQLVLVNFFAEPLYSSLGANWCIALEGASWAILLALILDKARNIPGKRLVIAIFVCGLAGAISALPRVLVLYDILPYGHLMTVTLELPWIGIVGCASLGAVLGTLLLVSIWISKKSKLLFALMGCIGTAAGIILAFSREDFPNMIGGTFTNVFGPSHSGPSLLELMFVDIICGSIGAFIVFFLLGFFFLKEMKHSNQESIVADTVSNNQEKSDREIIQKDNSASANNDELF